MAAVVEVAHSLITSASAVEIEQTAGAPVEVFVTAGHGTVLITFAHPLTGKVVPLRDRSVMPFVCAKVSDGRACRPDAEERCP